MKRHLGRVALLLSMAGWIGYFAALFVGGIDPSPELSRILQTVVLCSLLVVLLSLCLALFALVRGPQRLAAAIALVLGVLYALAFSGLLFALLA